MTLTAPPVNATRSPSLRSLSFDEFENRYSCDRFTAAMLASRANFVMEHVCSHILRTAFSPIIREFHDFSAAILAPPSMRYSVSAVAKTMGLFFGVMRDAVANTVEELGAAELRPGDVLISNDPYRTGTHVNDMSFIRPIFDGSDLVGFINITAHMADLGGTTPGGFNAMLPNKFELGMTVPPMWLVRSDEAVDSTLALLRSNTRFPRVLDADVRSLVEALRLGERLVLETIERYGAPAYLGAIQYACDASAEAISTGLMALPDGVYEGEDALDCDGVDASMRYLVRATISKVGDRVEVDIGGTSVQGRTAVNGSWPDLKGVVAIALKLLLDPHTPFTSAVLRNVDIVAPQGTVLTGTPPGAVFYYWEPEFSLLRAIFRALSPILGEAAIAGEAYAGHVHMAYGERADGSPWVEAVSAGGMPGAWGATSSSDGDSGASVGYLNNFTLAAVEATEMNAPMLLMRMEYAPDTAGAGEFRGGAALIKDSVWITDASATSFVGHERGSFGDGACGGRNGATGGVWLWDAWAEAAPDGVLATKGDVYRTATPVAGMLNPRTFEPDPNGEYFYWGSQPVWRTSKGAVWRYHTQGAGGWGDPLVRAPSSVLRDVRDGYVSLEGARFDYGVVVEGDPEWDPENLIVNEEATSALRKRMASESNGVSLE